MPAIRSTRPAFSARVSERGDPVLRRVKPLGELADQRPGAAREPLYLQQHLVLQRRDAFGPAQGFTGAQEAAQQVAKLGTLLEVVLVHLVLRAVARRCAIMPHPPRRCALADGETMARTAPSTQGVEVRGDVARLGVGDAHVGHRIAGDHALRIADPANQVGRRVAQHAGDVGALAEAGQRRPDIAVGARNAGHRVAGGAAVARRSAPDRARRRRRRRRQTGSRRPHTAIGAEQRHRGRGNSEPREHERVRRDTTTGERRRVPSSSSAARRHRRQVERGQRRVPIRNSTLVMTSRPSP